jgi:hypothetical protein
MAFTIKTNNVPRATFSGYELTDKEKAEFDYYAPEELNDALFFRYKGNAYDIGEFLIAPESLKPWHGYLSDSFFSGIVVKYANNNEQVIVGKYYS